MHIGKVWLVGAGPGDIGLLTLKGKKVLEEAQVVVYDALVGEAILTHIPENAEMIYVGKRAGSHTMQQEQINEELVHYAKQGKKVVRLKGGDPFLFGRGGEEIEALRKENIPYEIVPGVPSAIAVPAYNGIPVTHRDYCSSIHIITGHKKGNEGCEIDFESLIKLKGTYIFLMGVSSLATICAGFLNAGMQKDMPAAILAQGTNSNQKHIIATVETLTKKVQETGISRPAILVIGEVCSLADGFAWIEKLPLFGTRVIVTRPKERQGELSQKLRDLGAEVLEIPAIATVELPDNRAYKDAMQNIMQYQWVLFTSPSGVNMTFQKWKKDKIDVRCLAKAKIAVIGEATQKELEKRGIFADVISEKYDGETLGRELSKQLKEKDRVLILRGQAGNLKLIEEMKRYIDIQIDDIALYETQYRKTEPYHLIGHASDQNNTVTVFTSSSTVKGFAEAAGEIEYQRIKAVCIGKQTKEQADKFGMQTYQAEHATMESLVQKVIEIAARAV